jgi:hypothetical protein
MFWRVMPYSPATSQSVIFIAPTALRTFCGNASGVDVSTTQSICLSLSGTGKPFVPCVKCAEGGIGNSPPSCVDVPLLSYVFNMCLLIMHHAMNMYGTHRYICMHS